MTAVITTLEFPALSERQYEALGIALARFEPAAGLRFHACGPSPGGWRIVEVWDSQEDWSRFLNHTLLPVARTLGFPEPSLREVIAAHHAGSVDRAY